MGVGIEPGSSGRGVSATDFTTVSSLQPHVLESFIVSQSIIFQGFSALATKGIQGGRVLI